MSLVSICASKSSMAQHNLQETKRPVFLPEDFTENKVLLKRGGKEYFDLLKRSICKSCADGSRSSIIVFLNFAIKLKP